MIMDSNGGALGNPATQIHRTRSVVKFVFAALLILPVGLLCFSIGVGLRLGEIPMMLAAGVVLALIGAPITFAGCSMAYDAFRALRPASGAPMAAVTPWWKKAIAVVLLLGLVGALTPPARRTAWPRELVADALMAGISQKNRVTEFYQKRGRLPQASEAAAFQIAPSELIRSAHSVAWDADGRRIVVTLGKSQPGTRFALLAEERGGPLIWPCRTIELDVKYLPGGCQ